MLQHKAGMNTKQFHTKLHELLENNGEDESVLQSFFENNPSYVPGPFGLIGQSGHYPYAGTVISQPSLVGLTKRIPDFMWLSCDSCTISPVLVEIEAPNKRWFNKDGTPNHQLVQALDQLSEWKQWFSNPAHQVLFYDLFNIPSSFREGKALRPLYVLVYGRRSEFEGEAYLNQKRSTLARADEFLMTYDRIVPSSDASDMLCSKVKNGRYYAVAVPPTFTLGPALSQYHSLINDKADAVKNCKELSEPRKQFLLERLPYWDTYGKSKEKGIMNTGDRE
ncbi:Shedu anti-phage system protein SduA domain-containing protein [Paenibacillus validus]|uniref:Shedu anti-phage system protein SduA domain-containing protein n=1 Tax=Paenibacillus validus TaxID=44253 RepID=UPI003D2D17DA